MNESNRKILRVIQSHVPLVHRPWQKLAGEVGLAVADVTGRVLAMRLSGLIRNISGVFDSSALGYSRSLVALQVPSELLDQAGAVVSAHPGVSHCYSRADEYNLWFTLACSPDSSLGLESTVETLAKLSRARARLILPARRQFKLNVRFNFDAPGQLGLLQTAEPPPAVEQRQARPGLKISEEHAQAIRALQCDLPCHTRPFAAIARKVGLAEDRLFALAGELFHAGVLRRYAASISHRQAGAQANIMVAWRVEAEHVNQAGAIAAKHPAVSHCYLRPPRQAWPYSLYTMIHSHTRGHCTQAIEEISAQANLGDRRELWTVHEYKKQPVQFFSREEAAWEAGRSA